MIAIIEEKCKGVFAMDYLLLAIATLSASGKALFCKIIGTEKGRTIFLANFQAFAVATLVSLLFLLSELSGIGSISLFTLGLSFVFAGSLFFTQIMQMKAMSEGPASLTTLIYSSAFLIPIVFGAVAWQEPIRTMQYLGIAIMLVALFLIVWQKDSRAVHKRWLLFVFLSALGSGANAILQKVHQFSEFRHELKYFLLFALFFSSLFSLLGYLFWKKEPVKQRPLPIGPCKAKLHALAPIPLGISVAFLNFLNLILAGRLPSVIQFPIYNIGSLLLTSAISVLAFHERLSTRKLVGFFVGMIAIILVGMF